MGLVNKDGDIVLLNVQAERQFGYHSDELVGQKVTNIIPQGFTERRLADGTRSTAEALAQQIGMRLELIGKRKDGSAFPIELMLSPLDSTEGMRRSAICRRDTSLTRNFANPRRWRRSAISPAAWRTISTTCLASSLAINYVSAAQHPEQASDRAGVRSASPAAAAACRVGGTLPGFSQRRRSSPVPPCDAPASPDRRRPRPSRMPAPRANLRSRRA